MENDAKIKSILAENLKLAPGSGLSLALPLFRSLSLRCLRCADVWKDRFAHRLLLKLSMSVWVHFSLQETSPE